MKTTLNRLVEQYKHTHSQTVRIAVLDEITEESNLARLQNEGYISDYTYIETGGYYTYWNCTLAQKAIIEATQEAQIAQSVSPTLRKVNIASTNAQKVNNQPKITAKFDINQINQPLWIGIGFCILGFLFYEPVEFLAMTLLVIGTLFVMIGLMLHNMEKSSEKEAKERAKKYELRRKYSDPEWRNSNPISAAQVERELQQEKERLYGPAVRINNVEKGYSDRNWWYSYANSAGGWSVRCKIENIGARQIKYVVITFAAYNAVGDKCYCRTHAHTDATCRFTGPLYAGFSSDWVEFQNLWYDIAMSRVSVEHIHVDFMDGKSQDIDKNGKITNHGF